MKKIGLMVLLVLLQACASREADVEVNVEEVVEVNPIDEIDLSLKPDESGEIMVLMYHGIGSEESDWVRTSDNFRKDLQTLYDEGFRPISLGDFISGNITTEAGYTPFVLTFDDGRIDNYRILEDGSIDPNCALGILIEFNEAHPDFSLEATFFLTGDNIFGQSKYVEQKLNHIIELGMDLGNHTLTHPNFSKITDASTIQKEMGQMIQRIESYLHSEYSVNTLALTYGSKPKNEALMETMVKGSYEGIAYEHLTLLRVGSNPSLSPFDLQFNPLSVPRIRASEMNTDGVGLYDYLARYENYPEKRFISDGNVDIVTIPREKMDVLNPNLDKEIYAY